MDAPLSQGSGEFLLWAFPLAFWMEKAGYDVSYVSNVDTHADSRGLLRTKGWLSVGHDEYWSLEMYKNVKAAIAAGVNVAFLSADTSSASSLNELVYTVTSKRSPPITR